MSSVDVEWALGLSGAQALQRYAPEAAAHLARLAVTIAADPYWVALARWACAAAQELDALPAPSDSPTMPSAVVARDWSALSRTEQVLLQFAEQFSVDVSAIDETQRSALWSALGEEPPVARGRYLAMTWVADYVPRVRFVLDRLFARTPSWSVPLPEEIIDDATPRGREFVRVVYNLHHLDPVLSEMVRLRGAHAHDCRMCKSLRSRPALAAGAEQDYLATVGAGGTSGLAAAQAAALAMVDAIIWTPARVSDDVLDGVREHFTPPQAVELVLDVMRNAWNKTTVAAVLDAPHVDAGFEVYEYRDDGVIDWGLDVPTSSRA